MNQNVATTLTHDSIEQFQKYLHDRGRGPKTLKSYGADLKMLLRHCKTDEIGLEDLEQEGMEWLQENRRTVAPKTTLRRLTSLKAFSRWAGLEKAFHDFHAPTPLRGQPHPLPEGIDGVLRMIEVATNERHKALIALCGLCGCRVAEAIAVEPDDFDMETMTLKIRGKGEKERLVPVSDRAFEVLATPIMRARMEDRTVVGLKDRGARAAISDLGVKAKLKRHISSHDLRATFATAVYDKTLDLRLAQELLGHASSSTTELYTRVAMGKMRGAVEL